MTDPTSPTTVGEPIAAIEVPAVTERAPRKWLGRFGGWIILGSMTFFWLANLLYDQLVDHRIGLSPNSLVLGGFGMASALVYTMAYRLRREDGITPLRLVLAFLLGGLFSTELAIFAEIGVGFIPVGGVGNETVLVHALAGVVEEACKILAVIIAARGLAVRNIRTGLFMGGAVGFGFAAFEDMKYAVASLNGLVPGQSGLGAVLEVTLTRDVLGPLEHPILTAFVAAALFASTRNGRFRITPLFVGAYLVMATIHGMIDTLPILATDVFHNSQLGNLAGSGIDLLLAVGLGVAWLVFTRRLKRNSLAAALEQPVETLA